ncbi:unnamed protein product, partial [Urochloa humidicola]
PNRLGLPSHRPADRPSPHDALSYETERTQRRPPPKFRSFLIPQQELPKSPRHCHPTEAASIRGCAAGDDAERNFSAFTIGRLPASPHLELVILVTPMDKAGVAAGILRSERKLEAPQILPQMRPRSNLISDSSLSPCGPASGRHPCRQSYPQRGDRILMLIPYISLVISPLHQDVKFLRFPCFLMLPGLHGLTTSYILRPKVVEGNGLATPACSIKHTRSDSDGVRASKQHIVFGTTSGCVISM